MYYLHEIRNKSDNSTTAEGVQGNINWLFKEMPVIKSNPDRSVLDSNWFMYRLNHHFKISQKRHRPLLSSLNRAIAETQTDANAFLTGYRITDIPEDELPRASCAIIHINGNRIDCLVVGDCSVAVKKNDEKNADAVELINSDQDSFSILGLNLNHINLVTVITDRADIIIVSKKLIAASAPEFFSHFDISTPSKRKESEHKLRTIHKDMTILQISCRPDIVSARKTGINGLIHFMRGQQG